MYSYFGDTTLGPLKGNRRWDGRADASRIYGQLWPVQLVPAGVSRKDLFVFDQHGAHDGRFIGMAEFGHEIGNQVLLPMRVDESKSRSGNRDIGQIVLRSFGEVFDDVRQEFQLFDQVRIIGRLNLRKRK